MLMVASYSVNSSFVINYLVFAVFMDPNVTLHVIDSWMISIPGLIPQYPLSLLVTSIWFFIAPLIAQALICPTLPVRALPLCGIFLRPAVSSMFGGICISRLQAIPGPGRMGVLLPVLILLMFLIFGCLLSCAMIPFRVLFLTIAAFSCLLLFPMLLPLVQAFGSSILPFSKMRSMSSSSRTPGCYGEPPSLAFLLWRSGGRRGRASSRALPFASVVTDPLLDPVFCVHADRKCLKNAS